MAKCQRKTFIKYGPYKTHTKIASTLGMLAQPHESEVLSYLPRVSRSQEVIIGALLVVLPPPDTFTNHSLATVV